MVGLVAAYKKTTDETAGFWRDTGFVRLQQRAGTEHHEQQADQPATISPGVCRSSVRAVYRSSVLSLPCAFSVSFFGLLLLQHGFIDEKSTCFSCFALQFCIYIVSSKNKEKVQKTCVFCTFKAQILISACWTVERDEQLWDRTTCPWSEKSSIHAGFRAFLSQ